MSDQLYGSESFLERWKALSSTIRKFVTILAKAPTDPYPEEHVSSIHRHHAVFVKLANSASIVTRIWAFRPRDRGLIPEGDKNLLCSSERQDQLWDHEACHPVKVTVSFFRCTDGRGVKLKTLLHLVPRLNMRGAITQFPCAFFKAWCVIKPKE